MQEVAELQYWSLLSSPGVYRPPSTFWSITLQPLEGYQATIYQVKWDIHTFHLRLGSLVSIHRLQRKFETMCLNLNVQPLVYLVTTKIIIFRLLTNRWDLSFWSCYNREVKR